MGQALPEPFEGDIESEIEIRPVFEAEDFGAEYTPELREQEERLRSRSPRSTASPEPDRRRNTTMKIEPYLFFNGRCEEAVEFYRKALGAEVEMLMRFKESPEPPSPDACRPAGRTR